MMSKRIAFVYINPFKSYPILYEYCTGLKKLGFEIYYIGIGESNESFIDDSGVHVTHINKTTTASRWEFARLVQRNLRSIKPDLVHVFHFRWCFLLPVAALFSNRFLLDVRTVHVANRKGKYTATAPLKNALTWFESKFFRHAIALSPAIRKMLQPSFKKIPVIPLGANLSTFNPTGKAAIRTTMRSALGLNGAETVFLYAGTLSPARRIDVILHAFNKLCKNNEEVFLVIAGDDKDNPDTLTDLKRLSGSLGISGKLLFTGFLSYDELVRYSLASDAGLCYIPQTPFYDYQPPTKLFEYMAADLVVIATRTKANEQIISDNVNGYLCNDNADDLCACMKKAAETDIKTRTEITLAAQQSIKNYSWDYIVANYLCGYYNTFLD